MMNLKELQKIYIDKIQDDFLPYWLKFVDDEDGGILNCINNRGDEKIADDKFTWSQGRWLFILSRVYMLAKKGHFPKVDTARLEEAMAGTFRFIKEKSVYGEDICCYLLTKDGTKLIDKPTGRYDASIYADCFALIGSSQYAKAVKNQEAAKLAHRLYRSITSRIERNDFLTEPYPIPDGYKIHSIPMILVNSVQEYMDMCTAFGLDITEPKAYAREKVLFILDELYDGKGHIREHVSANGYDYLLDRHINPGHTLEDLWFLAENLETYGGLEAYLPRIAEIAKTTFKLGWDTKFGGLLRYVDVDGGQPKGKKNDSAYENLVVDTWDMKLWWPHSEILFLFPYLYTLTGDPEFEALYEKSAEYVFRTFPNTEIGEWIQIRKRNGEPQDKLVALPVKDPFHILRNYIKIVELADK